MNKLTRLLAATLGSLASGGVAAYDTIHKNEPSYQAHPVVAILTDFIGAAVVVFIFYFGYEWFVGRKEIKLKPVSDEKFYEEVASEMLAKPLIPGLWTKAYAEMGGDEAKARALYIKYRVAQLAEVSRQEFEKSRFEKRLARRQLEHPKRDKYIKVVFAAALVVAMIWPMISFSNKPTAHESYDFIGSQKEIVELGNANAAISLGFHYSQGIDVQKDNVEAYHWYSIAVALGSERARDNLTNIESNMTPEQIATAKQLSAALVARLEKKYQRSDFNPWLKINLK